MKYLTPQEASKILKLAPDTVRRYINRGLISAKKHGNTWAVPLSECRRYNREKRGPGRISKNI